MLNLRAHDIFVPGRVCLFGEHSDWAAEYGIATIRRDIDQMTAREQPPYSPVATRWLFSLIRLDDGSWTFRRGSGGSGRY